MKITKSFLKQVIKEELSHLEEELGREEIVIKMSLFKGEDKVMIDGQPVSTELAAPLLDAARQLLMKTRKGELT